MKAAAKTRQGRYNTSCKFIPTATGGSKQATGVSCQTEGPEGAGHNPPPLTVKPLRAAQSSSSGDNEASTSEPDPWQSAVSQKLKMAFKEYASSSELDFQKLAATHSQNMLDLAQKRALFQQEYHSALGGGAAKLGKQNDRKMIAHLTNENRKFKKYLEQARSRTTHFTQAGSHALVK